MGLLDCPSSHGRDGWPFASFAIGKNRIVCGICHKEFLVAEVPLWMPREPESPPDLGVGITDHIRTRETLG
jgi:hypothetical protein